MSNGAIVELSATDCLCFRVTSFPEAAQELCLETARRAELSQGGRVLVSC